ncbi:MAG TPA: imidazoleglycerol-phosphate dehydratase [Candidatus Omnitrophota bacterium]|nr:imidazoleglycerol-phosphate dehydratase [Candidatus Omnitrophota bacterium]HPT07499.1 imidazoleglycerol-phosphate dehydratase [Candidatus Omnitrophota bacterium]
MKKRTAIIKRKTRETDISVKVSIDGSGITKIKTGIAFLDHMLELFAYHGLFDLQIQAQGDLAVDIHHTNEDIGIALGQAFKKALGSKAGIKRFGFMYVPMEEVLASATIDINGRGYFSISQKETGFSSKSVETNKYSFDDAIHFFDSFAKQLGANLTITVNPTSPDIHTTLEPIFKAFGLALDQATQIDPRRKGVPSTKGVID